MERGSGYVRVVDVEFLPVYLEDVALLEEVFLQGDDLPMERPVERRDALILGGPPFLRLHDSCLFPSFHAGVVAGADGFGADDCLDPLFLEI